MKKIILIAFLFATVSSYAQKVDTTKKYVLTLTLSEYQALQEKLDEAAAYEAQVQKEKASAVYQDFLKKNTKELPNKEAK